MLQGEPFAICPKFSKRVSQNWYNDFFKSI